MSKNICFGTILVEDTEVVRGRKSNNLIKRKIENAVFTEGAEEYKGYKIVIVLDFKVVGKSNK